MTGGPDGAGGSSRAGEDGFEEVVDGDVTWRFDVAFLRSHWTCIWGRGCLGILARPAPELGQGCCSVGAELADEDDARRVSAMAQMLGPEIFQYHGVAATGGIFADDRRSATRVVDGACIFLNRPGFAGGAGCALHLGALGAGDPPREWKPDVCWQLPVKVDWQPAGPDAGTGEVATVRRWARADWGEDGDEMAWCCTEGERAYVGEAPVIESLADQLEAMVGADVFDELRRRPAFKGPRPAATA